MEDLVLGGVAVVGFAIAWLVRRRRGRNAVPAEFVVFDVETTGLDPDRHELIEIGAIRVRRDEVRQATYQALIRPSRKIPPKITQLTGITQDMVERDGLPLKEALAGFVEFIGSCRLVAHNVDFDAAFLRAALRQAGIDKPGNPLSCSLDMARRAWPKRRSYRLVDLARDHKLDGSDAHRALADAVRTAHVYVAAARALRSPH